MYEVDPMQPRAMTLDEYKEMKLEMLDDFCIKLTEEEMRHMMSLESEIKVDQFCITKIMNY
jgi:hypothetical protein